MQIHPSNHKSSEGHAEIGAARYLLPLDADHAHLAVPVELWREKYSRTEVAQLLPQILHDPALIALYHTAEHLSITDSTGSPIAAQIKQWKATRNVLGFYGGRPVRILPAPPDGAADERFDSYQVVAGFLLSRPSAGGNHDFGFRQVAFLRLIGRRRHGEKTV